MKGILIITALHFSITGFCQDFTLDEIRSCFLTTDRIEEIDKLIEISTHHLDHPVVNAYNCTGKLMMLDFKGNPIEKWIIFTNQTNKLDSIINGNPNNIEIRMLRYTIQKNSPSFLFYDNNIKDDLNMIKQNLAKENTFLQEYLSTTINAF